MWDKRVLAQVDNMVGTYSVWFWWQGVVDGFKWAYSRVYGPNESIERGYTWDELI